VLLSDAPRDVTIDHNTIIQGASGGIIKIANGVTARLTLTNNLAGHGDYGIIGRDRGVGNDSIAAYLPGAVITHNVLAGGKASAYPAGNLFPSLEEFRSQFVDVAARDCRLTPASAWLHAASDGRALGADLTQLAPYIPARAHRR